MEASQLGSGLLFANRFEIERAAGRGGMGTVYRARDRYSGEVVALKLLRGGGGEADDGARFAREAQLLSELRHPGIVSYIDHGQTPDGQRFLAMEWLEGHDLSHALARGALPLRDCVALLVQVSEALAVAHRKGIVHRDLKPSNLFLVGGEIDQAKLLDFGIARRIATSQVMTRTGSFIGTPEYMAPEQARGLRDLKPAVDMFALGCILYECLTGKPPFLADHLAAVLVRILCEEPIPIEEQRPGVPASIVALVARLLAKEAEERPADATALRTELVGLGEVPELDVAPTIATPSVPAILFAESEQNLVSVVLAAPREARASQDSTVSQGDLLGASEQEALLGALQAVGVSAQFLASGPLIVTVPLSDSATDQAVRAARAAFLIKQSWPLAVVSMATGRGSFRGRSAVGEVVDVAVRALQTESEPSATTVATGVIVDTLSARLLQGRFVQTSTSSGARLVGEERDVDATRPLLGKPTPCVGREAELNNLEGQIATCIEESEARAVLVVAASGMGKSRLRHELSRRVAQRSEPLTMLLGRGDMMSAGLPYGILSTALRAHCDVSGAQPVEVQRARLLDCVTRCIAAAEQRRVAEFIGELCGVPFEDDGSGRLASARSEPSLMRNQIRRAFLDWLRAECDERPVMPVLDDLHWGDTLSVDLLDEALRELHSRTPCARRYNSHPLGVVEFRDPAANDHAVVAGEDAQDAIGVALHEVGHALT